MILCPECHVAPLKPGVIGETSAEFHQQVFFCTNRPQCNFFRVFPVYRARNAGIYGARKTRKERDDYLEFMPDEDRLAYYAFCTNVLDDAEISAIELSRLAVKTKRASPTSSQLKDYPEWCWRLAYARGVGREGHAAFEEMLKILEKKGGTREQ